MAVVALVANPMVCRFSVTKCAPSAQQKGPVAALGPLCARARNQISGSTSEVKLETSFLGRNAARKISVPTGAAQAQSSSKYIKAGLLDFLIKPSETKGQQREEIKQELLEALKPLDRGAEATPEDEEAIEELVQKLEAVNPTKAPLRSPLINGKWELLYTTSEGILKKNRPKFLRPKGPIYQCIDTNTLQARNIETWPYFNQVQATLNPLSSNKVDVKFDKFKIAGVLSVNAPESAKGDLTITYLDDTLRIARGNKGNLFVLTMDDPTYTIDN